MNKRVAENLQKMKEAAKEILSVISEIENTPKHLLPHKINRQNDILHTLIIRLYSFLAVYQEEASAELFMPLEFPPKHSKFTEIQEIREDYIRIKMPLLYRKNREDPVLANDLDAAFLDAIRSGKDIPIIRKKEICFTFYYNSKTDKNLIRDNDNYSIKGVINTIALRLRSSDRGDNTWISLRTVIADDVENHTIIEIKRID